MSAEQFHLSRNDFHLSTAGTFKSLLEETNFVDVTLACEDDKQIMAHKVILSANIEIFKNVLVKNIHQHPLRTTTLPKPTWTILSSFFL